MLPVFPWYLKAILKAAAAVCLVILIILSGALYYILGTTKGAAWAADFAGRQLQDVLTLKVDVREGSIFSGLKLGSVLVEVPDTVRVEADSLDASWDLMRVLLHNVFEVSLLETANLTVTLLITDSENDSRGEDEQQNSDEEAYSSDEEFRLNFPVDIIINDFRVTNFAYLSEIVDVRVGEFAAVLEAGSNSAGVRGGNSSDVTVHLKDLTTKEELAALQMQEENELKEILNAHERQEDDLREAIGAGAYSQRVLNRAQRSDIADFGDGRGLIENMPTIILPLDVYILGLEIKKARYYMDGFDTGKADLNVSASWKKNILEVINLEASHDMGQARIYGMMDFSEHFKLDYKISGQGALSDFNRDNFEGLLYGLKGSGEIAGNLVDLRANFNLENPQNTALEVRINCLSSLIPLAVTLDSDYLSWPLFSDTPEVEVYNLHLKSYGSLIKGLKTSLKGTFSGFDFEDYQADFEGVITPSKTEVNQFNLEGFYAGEKIKASLKGSADYYHRLGFAGSLDLESTSLSFISPLLQGPVSLTIEDFKAGVVPGWSTMLGDLNIFLHLPKSQGKFYLNGRPAALSLQELRGNFDRGFDLQSLNIAQGENTITAHGNLSDNSRFMSTFAFNDLSIILPDLEGTFDGELAAFGRLDDLNLDLRSRAFHLKQENFQLRELILDASTNTKAWNFEVIAIANDVHSGADLRPLGQCVLDLSGTLVNHFLSFNCEGNAKSFLGISGGLDENFALWQGQVEEFFAQTDFSGSVSLVEPIKIFLNLNESSGSLSAFSLRGDNGVLEFEDTVFSPDNIAAGVHFSNYNLRFLNDLMPEEVRLEGPVSVKSKILVKNGLPDINISVDSDDTRIFAHGVPFLFDKVAVTSAITPDNLKLNTTLHLRNDRGGIKLDLNVKDPMNSRRLDGDLSLAGLDLALLTGVGSQFNDLQGKVDIEGSFSGNVTAPLFHGTIKAQGSAEPRIYVGQVDDFEVTINAMGSRGFLDGAVSLNGTPVNLKGTLDWAEGAEGDLSVTASRLPVFLIGYGQALADINTHVSFKDAFVVEGSIAIPEARIRVNNIIDSGAQPSSDEIIVPEGGTMALAAGTSQTVPSVINLNLTLGDGVRLSAMGLNARMTGELAVKKALEDRDVTGEGQINLEEGRADLFGHRFIVTKAQTIFHGSIADPRLDVEVIADPEDIEDEVTAGVRVTGTASDPRIALFSSPAMSDNEVLSYILYGHGLDKNNSFNQESTNSSQMLLGLGLGPTTGLVNSLVGAFGVQNVQVGASGSGDETQVSVQGYITRRIRISYGYGVFNAVGEFKIRYELMRRLYAEFVSSIDQAADLIYSFEF